MPQMGVLEFYGISAEYEEKPHGIISKKTDDGESYSIYSGFHPPSLENTARDFSRDEFIEHLNEMMKSAQEPKDWEPIRHNFGWVPDAEKSEALRNTRALLAEILKALGKE